MTPKQQMIENALAGCRDQIDQAFTQLQQALIKSASEERMVGGLADLGRLTEDYKKAHGLKFEDLAMLSGKSRNAVSKACRSPQTAGMSTIISILDVMGYELTISHKAMHE